MLRFVCGVFGWWLLTSGALAASTFQQRLAEFQARLANEPTNTALIFKLADICYDEGARDNSKAVELAEKYFQQLLTIEPRNALAQVMLGSTQTMKARDAFWPPTRLELARKGNKTMDAAVELAPQNPEVRFVRAINNFHMPKFMGREEVVRNDFAWLWQQVTTQPQPLKEELKQDVALYQGKLLWKQKQAAQAREVWNRGVAFNPDSKRARSIKEQLTAHHSDGAR
ncbi:MAG: hypothetical protein HY043_21765 [Verrucomicrobia bacterium]|nr:hypothetical protein [Verrucomicrobiota bacterium]